MSSSWTCEVRSALRTADLIGTNLNDATYYKDTKGHVLDSMD